MWDEPKAYLKYQSHDSFRTHEGCGLLKTAGRWPWKSESAKECVTTHLPKQPAPKMDDA